MTSSASPGVGETCRTADLIAIIPSVRALARCLCIDPVRADALARDCVTAAWDRRNTLADAAAPTLWAFAIVCEQFRETDGSPARASAYAANLDRFQAAVAGLTAERREALALVVAARLTYRSAAEVCGATIGAIKYRLSRARRELFNSLLDTRPATPPPLATA